jgi:ATP-dependent Clp protease protease subunit
MKKLPDDHLAALMEYGIDRINRRLFLGDIEEQEVSKIIRGIYFFEAESKTQPIELFVSSYGGELDEMFGLYDVLNTIECPIITVAIGKCQSAAPLLVAAGKQGERYALPNTSFMFHQSSATDDECRGPLSHIEANIKQHRVMEDRWYGLLSKHSNKAPAFWRKLGKLPHDTYYTAEQAIEFGIVDQLWNQKEGES